MASLFSSEPSSAWPWLAALTLATAAGWAVDAVVAKIGFDLGFSLLEHTQRDIADRLTHIRLSWFTAENTATARQAIAATGPDLVGMIIYLVTPLLNAILLPIAIAIAFALLPISVPLGLAALAGVIVLLGAFFAAGRIGRNADRAVAEKNSVLTERIVEFARTQQALRAARRVEPAHSTAGAALAAQHGATIRLLLMQIPGQVLFSVASQLALVLLAGTTAVLAVRGDLGVPEAIALIVVIARYLEPFAALGELTPGIETATTVLRRLRAVLDAPVIEARDGLSGDERVGDNPVSSPAPRIDLQGVSFRYAPDGVNVLDDINLTLEPGSTTAIVGPSGSGKSTVLALLAGLHEPTDGCILIDGVNAANLDHRTRRESVSFVFQHPYLFDGTIIDNIIVGRPNATADDIATATTLAMVDELTDRLPGGMEARVGEAGSALSGGERQRVIIARALVKPASLLLVDEATSALDTENEVAIVRALTADQTARTKVIVAHKLAGIRSADRVVFLEAGRIVEDGTIHELLNAEGRFAEFWRQQEGSTAWRLTAATGGNA
ncbi:MAG TPA: ATP-binding cassette domain-containing protein [Candidatus Stackebrandtia excrementipullorum]|nr:ATP-binding cassette domain-containing protein [Candidatus Stackebrandtia excrementipullorum]